MMVDWRVEKFDFHHLKEFASQSHDKGRLVNEDPVQWKLIAGHSVAYSFFVKDRFIFCGGVLIYRAGFGEAWILCSEDVALYPRTVFKLMREYLQKVINDHSLYRVQATVRCDWPQAQRFVMMFGFTPEGILRKYGTDKSDYKMYARIE